MQNEQDTWSLSDGSAAGSGRQTASSWERGQEERLGEGYGDLLDARAILAGFKARGSSGPRGLADGDLRGSWVPVRWVVSPGQGCSPISRGLGRREGQLLTLSGRAGTRGISASPPAGCAPHSAWRVRVPGRISTVLTDPQASQVAQWVKNPPAVREMQTDASSVPGLGRSPGGGHGSPSSILAWRPMDRGGWRATVHGGRKESDTTERRMQHAQTLRWELTAGPWGPAGLASSPRGAVCPLPAL